MTTPRLAQGIDTIKGYLATLPESPGVYRMLNDRQDVLYVGKANSLRKRVTSYTQENRLTNRLARMVAETTSMEFVTCKSEVEALLLESNLIKSLQPRYNVLLKDDKMFPYILFTRDHPYPQIVKHRGAKKRKGDYFGPFASAGAVWETVQLIQRIFRLRPCRDSYFAGRTRPCLQYQIKRCSAPCVGYISESDYAADVAAAQKLLQGQSQQARDDLAAKMDAAASDQRYEEAALYRDQLQALSKIQARQDINLDGDLEADVIALARDGGLVCVETVFYRGGQFFGNRAFFPKQAADVPDDELLTSFILQFYEDLPAPKLILTPQGLHDQASLENLLSEKAGHSVRLHSPQRGAKQQALAYAAKNAQTALARRLAEKQHWQKQLTALQNLLALDKPLKRVEVYDNSHIQGTNAVGGMIVADDKGFSKAHYRKFTIKDTALEPGDDYAMLAEVLSRRLKRSGQDDDWQDPDLMIIDGGLGQLNAAAKVVQDSGLDIPLLGVSKGVDRNAGREQLWQVDKAPYRLNETDPLLYFIQRLRDEAHRYAIGTHRAKRTKAMLASPLDGIPGIGAKRKKALLAHFGAAKFVASASVDDLSQVSGISKSFAQGIYDHFHE